MNIDEIKTQEDFEKGYEEFKRKFPDYREPRPIECLKLVMRKEYAEEILKGEKTVEFRAFSEHYMKRLNDNDVVDFMNKYYGTESEDGVMYYAQMVRPVRIIHFYSYSNTWHLDVECDWNSFVCVTDKDVRFLNERFGCHELDDMLAEMNARGETERPMFFAFACGKVTDTDLR